MTIRIVRAACRCVGILLEGDTQEAHGTTWQNLYVLDSCRHDGDGPFPSFGFTEYCRTPVEDVADPVHYLRTFFDIARKWQCRADDLEQIRRALGNLPTATVTTYEGDSK